ncbi:hypothetical protein [Nocardia alni]|uniref:hypothetical protein n=1 Tax=Nocardia alni TaxID=2815723 RepID=UPI001C2102DC|nr:hypothetical protein [Nocardia alni]
MSHYVDITAHDLSTAWLQTTLAVHAQPQRRAFHTVTRIADTAHPERLRIRVAADDLLAEFDLPPVQTVANTIFPAALAAQDADPVRLAARYQALYPQLKRLEPRNNKGTYFQRLIAYPTPHGQVNQLERLIATLTIERATAAPKRARYETSVDIPEPDVPEPISVPVYEPRHDTSAMAFPCLSMLSFQLDGTRLHAVAHYRSQYLLQRGYGNYLGISRLLGYIASRTGLTPGALTVVVGQAHADRLRRDLAHALRELATDLTTV